MKAVKTPNEWIQMKENIRRIVASLEVCCNCKRVSECLKYILGNTVEVWSCNVCLGEIKRPYRSRFQNRNRMPQ